MFKPHPDVARIPGQRFLHSPGPSRVPDEVLHAMSRQPMDLADPRVDQIISACESGLRRVLGSQDAEIFMYSANGHGAWEATMVNLVAPGQTVLMAGTGHFSESWAVQSEALGVRVLRTPWVEGEPIDPKSITQALQKDPDHNIVAVLVVHTDTASGVTSDIAAIRAAIDAAAHPALYVVDVVASLGCAPFHMDEWGVNVALGASQKGLMVPPGLAFVAADRRAFAAGLANPAPRYYWSWKHRQDPMSYRKFCGTPPESLLMGLQASLALIEHEGLDAVLQRHRVLAGAVHAAVEGWRSAGAVDFFCRVPQARSVSITAITLGGVHSVDKLRHMAREQFQVAIAGGLGPLTGRVFRIGHLGDLNPAMVLGCLGGVQAAMRTLGIPHGEDGVTRAVRWLSDHS